jgi:WD40 repeat protein
MSTSHPNNDALRHYLDVATHLEEHECQQCEEALRQLQGAAEIGPTVQLHAALAGPPAPSSGAEALPSIPGYELLEVLGEGGMGVVFKARHRALNRVVALKMVVHAAGDGRFRIEAEAAARLLHPHVVQIFEVGEVNGRPFLALEYCPGGSLADRLNGTPLPPTAAAGLVKTLAGAVHAAHLAGVVHRDLKPANVLLVEGPDVPLPQCTAKISDFGLAKMLGQAGHTESGAVLGTPSYMAPEQAGGKNKEIGPAADVWALGAILYELLTGRPPFKAASALDTLLQVAADDPVPPTRLQPKVPRDLETICLKCLHKEPPRRYASALELADDLGRFLGGEPIRARPVGVLERAARWVRRRPAVAALLALVLAVALAGLAGIAVYYHRAAQLLDTARSRELAASALVELPVDPELAVLLAARAGEIQPTPQAEDALRQALLEFHTRKILRRGDSSLVQSAAFDPTGQHAVTAHVDGTATVWEVASGKQVASLTGHKHSVQSAAFSPDGLLIVTASMDWTARVWDWKANPPQPRATLHHLRAVYGAAFSPSGKWIVTAGGDGVARVWDAQTGTIRKALKGSSDRLFSAAFSSDEGRIVTASDDGATRVWDWQANRPQAVVFRTGGSAYGAAFSPDGQQVVTANLDGKVHVWDLKDHKEVHSLEGHTGRVTDVAFSKDGRFLVSASRDTTARVWDAQGNLLRVLRGHKRMLLGAAFSPDGRTVVTAGKDGTARLWQARTDTVRISLPQQEKGVQTAALSADGRLVVTASRQNTVRVWDAQRGLPQGPEICHEGRLYGAAFGPAGRILTFGADGTARIWDWPAGAKKPLHTLGGHQSAIWSARFSPDGSLAVTAGRDGSVKVWNPETEECLATLAAHRKGAYDAAFSTDSRFLVTAGGDGMAKVWDWQADPTRPRAELEHPTTVRGAALSPDGRLVITACGDRIVRVWEWESDASDPRTILHGHSWPVNTAAFHPHNGRFAVTASSDGTARVWDVDRHTALLVLRGHDGKPVKSAAFSPDGRSVVTAGEDGTVQIHPFEVAVPLPQLLSLARARLTRDLTPQESQRYLTEDFRSK